MRQETSGCDLGIEGTGYFRQDPRLRRCLRVSLPVPFSGQAQVCVVAGGETVESAAKVVGGQAIVPGPATYDRPLEAQVAVSCPAGAWRGRATLPPTRPWTVYIAQDKHLDYGWIHPIERVVERMNVLTDYHLDAAARTGLRWNLDVSIWVEEYLRARPAARREQLLAALRSGRFEVGALWLTPFPGTMGLEEWLQSLYPARRLEDHLGVPVRTVSLQEVPSAPWGLATILAGAGFSHVVKGAYDLRNPHLCERAPLPLSAWEGPDGSRVLLRWDAYAHTDSWGGYTEAHLLWKSASDTERTRFVEDTLARYDAYADYPCDAILLAGTGHDGYPQTTAVSEFIQRFNAQGWAYPRLVDATWSQYWQDVERQLAGGRGPLPVVRGDWGTSWEEWPAQLAHLNTAYRRARETVLAGQALAALAYRFDPGTHPSRAEALAAAWRGLLQFADHNIGGVSGYMADDMRDRKATYAYTAAREGDRALQGGLATLAANIAPPAGSGRHLLVANPDSWARTGAVEVLVPEPGPYDVVDLESGRSLPCQIDTRGGWPEHYVTFVAPEVPSFGYRGFLVRPGPASAPWPKAEPAEPLLENGFFRLVVDSTTGGLRSLWDKAAGRELVAAGADFSLNQYLHFSDGTLHLPQLSSVAVRRGPVASCLIAEAAGLRARVRTTYTLYRDLPRLDILNELTKEPSSELQAGWFLFPFGVAGGQYHCDGPAAILRPGLEAEGGDLLPGAGRTCVAVQSFLAVANAEHGVILATPDANLFQFGEGVLANPLADSDPRSPLALSLAMHNFTRNDRAVDQGGQARFAFRYSVLPVGGPFQAGAAVRFAREAALPLPAAWASAGASGALSPAGASLLFVQPDSVIVTGLKVAEDGQGWILRLWECEGQATEAVVEASALGVTRAWRCDLLERNQETLEVAGGTVRLAVPARGLRALRLA